jgi:CDP-paratose 2-epimerase
MNWLITGGAGFIGANTASRLIRDGAQVVVVDNLSRKGASLNLEWLRGQGCFEFRHCDIRDPGQLAAVFRAHREIDVVLHLAAQVAVTTSVRNPREDFEINALGTFNICEAVRTIVPEAVLLNASTNKVYGEMASVAVVEKSGRYVFPDLPRGTSESQPLDFHSPYGCSKGAADQYVLDYARIYNLKAVSFRQSCIYGPRQFGIEDQGWVAWFAIAAVGGRPITIYGDGKQVRDILFVDDLIDCYRKAVNHIGRARGRAYNLGGGHANAASVLEVLGLLGELLGRKIEYAFSNWRPGDQRIFVSDITRATCELDWKPTTGKHEGIRRLLDWVRCNWKLFQAT